MKPGALKHLAAVRWLVGPHPRRTFWRAVAIVFFAILLFRFFLLPVRVRGLSMMPTYQDQSFHLANLQAYWRGRPQRGDPVVISMTGMRAFYLKRIIGLPGERISFIQGQLYIDGSATDEPYLPQPGSWTMIETRIGSNEYFVAGDNRSMPMEMHAVGFVERDKIKGRILF